MLQKRYLGCDFYVKNDVRVGTKVAKQIISNDDDDFFFDKLFRKPWILCKNHKKIIKMKSSFYIQYIFLKK